ncbi:cohesin domain-containing protein [Clostridium tertium]
MKKGIILITLIIIFFLPIKAYASTTTVEVNVDGKVKKGEEINILVNMKGLESLYAASVNFTYDNSFLNIVDITAGDSIKNYGDEIMEIGGEVDTSNNKTSYSFTFLGDKEGINGDATLAIIKAKVLKDGSLSIDEDDIKVKLVKRVDDGVENYDYKFIEYSTEDNVSNTEIKPNNSNNQGESSNSSAIDNSAIKSNDNNQKISNNTIENKASESSTKTLENNNENNSNSNDTNLDSTNDENIDKEEEELESNINSEKNSDELISSNNDKKFNLIIASGITLFILIGVISIYYYKSKKINSNK